MILKITQVITLSINQYSQTGNIDQWDNLSHIRQSGYPFSWRVELHRQKEYTLYFL